MGGINLSFKTEMCDLIKLIGFNKCDYMSSGYWGHAFDVGDKVVKLTREYDEYNSVKNHVLGKNIDGLVHYYDAFPIADIPNAGITSIRDHVKNGYLKWVIIMDKVVPLTKPERLLFDDVSNDFYMGIKRDKSIKMDFNGLSEFVIYSIYLDHYPNLIHSPAYISAIKGSIIEGYSKEEFKKGMKLVYLYVKASQKLLSQEIMHNDPHSGNIGWDPFGNLVFFDYS